MTGSPAMAAIASTSIIFAGSPSRCSLKLSSDQSFLKCNSMNLFVKPCGSRKAAVAANKHRFMCQAILSGGSGRPSSATLFIGGFLLGGLVVGTLGCVYAPQISRTLAEADSKDILRKLPKLIYDEDKVLERTRKKLEDKIEQLNAAIDGVSSQLRTDDDTDGASAKYVEIDAAV